MKFHTLKYITAIIQLTELHSSYKYTLPYGILTYTVLTHLTHIKLYYVVKVAEITFCAASQILLNLHTAKPRNLTDLSS